MAAIANWDINQCSDFYSYELFPKKKNLMNCSLFFVYILGKITSEALYLIYL